MNKIGVFDSGIGGLNIALELNKKSKLDITYLADNLNLPYGDKTDKEIIKILTNIMNWFIERNINDILIACNTASNYIDLLKKEFPTLEIKSIIEITSSQFINDNIIVFSTLKTAEKRLYDKYLNNRNVYVPLNELALLIEEYDLVKIESYLYSELKEYRNSDNKFLLACTHYSLAKNIFENILEKKVYDSINPTINTYSNYDGESQLKIFTSGSSFKLEKKIKKIYGLDLIVYSMNSISNDIDVKLTSFDR